MRCLLLCCCVSLLTACAGSKLYNPSGPAAADFQQRGITQSSGPLRVTAAVPTAAETLALTGLDLYAQGIQPVWMQVENQGDVPFWLVHKSVDPDYFSPIEVAYKNRKGYSKEGQAAMERWFWQSQLQRILKPGESMQGYIYTHLAPGTKGFNLEVVSTLASWDTTFFVKMPGFTADYMEVNVARIYASGDVREVAESDLLDVLREELPCCARSPDDRADGLPFSLVLLESPPALRRALLRASWQETSRDDPSTLAARQQQYLGRPPDAVFFKARADGAERKELRLWLAPFSSEGRRLVLAQAVHDLATGHEFQLDPDLNAARNYVVQSFWYGQSLLALDGDRQVPEVLIDKPAMGFGKEVYFYDGLRNFLWISDGPTGLDETRSKSMERVLEQISGAQQ